MVFATIYGWNQPTYNDYRIFKALITAKYNGLELKHEKIEYGVGNKTPEFLNKFPLGKTPALENKHVKIDESNAIAFYIANATETSLLGDSKEQLAEIMSVSSFADSELDPIFLSWFYGPADGAAVAKESFKRVLSALNVKLSTKTFLVAQRVTLADIILVCQLAPFYQSVLDASTSAPYPHVNRYFKTLINQPNFAAVFGDFKFCEKEKVFNGPASSTSSGVFGTIHKFEVAAVDRTAQALIAAKYNGINVKVSAPTDSKSAAFLAKFPLGKVPAFEGADGFLLTESSAIARYIASAVEDASLFGTSKKDAAAVESYIFVSEEFYKVQQPLLYHFFGYRAKVEEDIAPAFASLHRHLEYLNIQLATRTFLVGERVTLADIVLVSSLVNVFKLVLENQELPKYGNVVRWFKTCINQPNFKAVIGEFEFCKKSVVGSAGKASAPAAKPVTPKKEAAPKKEKAEKAEKVKKEPVEDLEAIAAAEQAKPKEKNPLDLLPKSSFVLDEWKRFYSNNDTRPTAVNWFWEHFDPEGYSIWKVDYKYNNELTQVFMSSNLVGGFYQRLERARKYAFGSMLVLGVDKKNQITGYFVIRGSEVPFEVSDSADYESYSFKKVDPSDPKVREDVNAVFAWDEKIRGLPCADGKVFK